MTDSITHPNFHSRSRTKFLRGKAECVAGASDESWNQLCLFELADHGKQEMCWGRRSVFIGASSSMTNHFYKIPIKTRSHIVLSHLNWAVCRSHLHCDISSAPFCHKLCE